MSKLALETEQCPIGLLFDYTHIRGFIIPEYQRPYAWQREQCEQLWEDIFCAYKFAKENNHNQDIDTSYFLGSIIVYPDNTEHGKRTIIDGQQRITTIMILLRSIYEKLESKYSDAVDKDYQKDIENELEGIRSMLWQPNDNSIFSDGKVNAKNGTPRLTRNNISVPNDIFVSLMRHGISDTQPDNCNEYINYNFFMQKLNDIEFPELKWLILFIKKLCFVLIIKTESEDSSLDMFDILNNRGMQLSDADIFKNRIAKSFKNRIKDFNENWSNLVNTIQTKAPEDMPMTLEDIFKHYMFAHRMSRSVEQKSKEPRLRWFYTKDDSGKKLLNNHGIVDQLAAMASFLLSAIDMEDFDSSESINSLVVPQVKYDISLLNKYQKNGRWLYLISTFWYCYHSWTDSNTELFKERFKKYIRYCTSVLFLKSILTQSSSDADIPQLCEKLAIQASKDGLIDIFEPSLTIEKASQLNDKIKFNRRILDGKFNDAEPDGTNMLDTATSILGGNTSKLNHLVLLYAYSFSNGDERQPILLKSTIEHILPQNWDTHYGTDWLKKFKQKRAYVDEYVEHLGNKIILARDRNIRSSDRDFSSKLRIYADNKASNSKRTFELDCFIDKYKQSTKWTKEDVDSRTNAMINVIIDYIRSGIEGGIA